MKIYLKNKTTGRITIIEAKEFNVLSKNVRDKNDEASASEITSHNKEILRKELIAIRISYLESKDKLWIQKMRSGKEIAQDIIDKSNLAVQEINDIEIATDFTNFSTKF